MSDAIVLDSSAVVAVLLDEPDAEPIKTALLAATKRWIGAFTALECSVVMTTRRGVAGQVAFEAMCQRLGIRTIPLTAELVGVARDAWTRFGRGRHPAALNVGDCCSYALARHSGFPLLCKGDDFPRTDLPLVPYAST